MGGRSGELGGISVLKQMDDFAFKRAAKEFPKLCREAAQRTAEDSAASKGASR
jgi:hypothetical protein